MEPRSLCPRVARTLRGFEQLTSRPNLTARGLPDLLTRSGRFSYGVAVDDLSTGQRIVQEGYNGRVVGDANPAPVPEPGSLILLATGLLGAGSRIRKRLGFGRSQI